MSPANELHSTHEMVRNLHGRFDSLDERIGELHKDHLELRGDVEELKKEVLLDKAHLDKHEAEACLKESAVLRQLAALTTSFDRHVQREESDRRWVLGIVLMTMIGSIGSLVMLVLERGT
jgi:predicted  nucleic acid-binding Zn-ribbon protein